MSGDDDPNAERARVNRNRREIVNHQQSHAFDLQRRGSRQSLGPRPAVVVSAHRGERRQVRQCLENPRIADVAGMHDVVAIA